MTASMRVVRGRLRTTYLDFPDGEFVLGRGPECSVRIGSELVSRQHCLLRIHGQDVHVRDLGSTNGTLVNGTLIVEECALGHGDTLQLAPLVLELVLDGQEPHAAPQGTPLIDDLG
jgi:predicted component of type VI protein secretion system